MFHKFIDRKATKQDLMDFTDKIDELLASALDTYNDTLGDAGDFGGVFFLGTNQDGEESLQAEDFEKEGWRLNE